MKPTCLVCLNVDCKSRGSEKLMSEITEKVAARGLDVDVKSYICFGGCDHGPNIVLYPEKIWYAGVKPEDLADIMESIAGGPKVDRLDTIDPSLKEMIFQLLDAGVF